MVFKEIKKLLIDKDLSQAEIARRIRVSKSHVNNMLRGKRSNARLQKAIAREMGCEVADLFGKVA